MECVALMSYVLCYVFAPLGPIDLYVTAQAVLCYSRIVL